MAVDEDLAPEPGLMESMRSVGYTLEAALADLIDNSISAQATEVDIVFSAHGQDFVAILDNGLGMTGAQARSAMRLAGNSSQAIRESDDLGRFGLGLKTASLSQCRDLCLVTMGPDGLVGLEWDLDHLLNTGRWSIRVLTSDEIESLPLVNKLANSDQGTLVLWRKLDALRAQVGDNAGLDAAMVDAKQHLRLVFHRFLGGEHGRAFTIRMNGMALQGADPFLASHKATTQGPDETFRVDGATVRVRPFTLPHLNKLTAKDRERAMIAGSLRDSQGFYVYRAMRLVIWGTWFRIRPKEDLAKLARVRVDIPNTLDHMWALDIKKSAAQPPPQVKQRLRRFGEKMVVPSKRTFTFRGRPVEDGVIRTWNLVENGPDFRYEINRLHPLVTALSESLERGSLVSLELVLRALEQTYPADDLFTRLSEDRTRTVPISATDEHRQMARDLWAAFRSTRDDPEAFVRFMRQVEPFDCLPDAETILKDATE